MKMMLKAGTFLLFCAAVLNEVNACTCLDYGAPTCALFSRADAVFVGKIERITSAMGDKDPSVQLGGVGSNREGFGAYWLHSLRGMIGSRTNDGCALSCRIRCLTTT